MIGRRIDKNRVEHLFWSHWYGWLKDDLIHYGCGVLIACCLAYMLAVGVLGSNAAAFEALLTLMRLK